MACLLKKGKDEKPMRVLSSAFVTRNGERIPRSVLRGELQSQTPPQLL